MQKKCTGCDMVMDLDCFSNQARGLYGKKSRCKKCVAIYNSAYSKNRYANDPEYRAITIKRAEEWMKNNPEKRSKIAIRRNKKEAARNPEKIKCRALVNQRVRFGRMPRASSLDCSNCGDKAAHYHHHKGYDFENRYEVVPVCVSCHKILD
jgi:hypothetical protein